MNRPEDVKGIGGSDAGTILGLNPWKTPVQLYLERIGEVPKQEMNDAMYFGTVLEALVANEYAKRTGSKIANVNKTLEHPKYPWMIGHVDRRVLNVQGGKGLEVKTARRADAWGESGTDEIPATYIAQCQHYMAVTGWSVFDVPVLIAGSDYRCYTVPRSNEFIEMMIEEEAKFMECLKTKTPPAAKSAFDVQLLYAKDTGDTLQATDEAAKALEEYRKIKAEAKALKDREDQLKGVVTGFMKGASVLVDASGNRLCSWKYQERAGFDTETFKAENPELYAKYAKPTGFRVLR